MKMVGRVVEVPQEAFVAALSTTQATEKTEVAGRQAAWNVAHLTPGPGPGRDLGPGSHTYPPGYEGTTNNWTGRCAMRKHVVVLGANFGGLTAALW